VGEGKKERGGDGERSAALRSQRIAAENKINYPSDFNVSVYIFVFISIFN
jgi:hypothetical protein